MWFSVVLEKKLKTEQRVTLYSENSQQTSFVVPNSKCIKWLRDCCLILKASTIAHHMTTMSKTQNRSKICFRRSSLAMAKSKDKQRTSMKRKLEEPEEEQEIQETPIIHEKPVDPKVTETLEVHMEDETEASDSSSPPSPSNASDSSEEETDSEDPFPQPQNVLPPPASIGLTCSNLQRTNPVETGSENTTWTF